LKTILNVIITSCAFKFPVDCSTILSFAQAVKTRSSGNLHLSYAFLSSRLSNPHTHPPLIISTIRRQLELVQGILHSCLDGPEHFHGIPNLPSVAQHFKVAIPFTNNMDESLQFFIEGISVSFLHGDQQLEIILTLCYLGYFIFNAVESLHSTFPPQDQFPHELTKIKTHFAISVIISIKKV
jgi:hypothetical protein